MKHKLLISLLFIFLLSSNTEQKTSVCYLFVGSYTEGLPSNGIYIYSFDTETGKLKKLSTVSKITNPSFITLSPNGRFLYACTETKLPTKGSVSAFQFDSVKATLSFLNKVSSFGENPVYLAVDKTNKYLVNANYTEGNISVFYINENGSINQKISQRIQFTGHGSLAERQDKAHIHAAVLSPNNDYVYFPDLGSDKIWFYPFNPNKAKPIVEDSTYSVATVSGSGPRHFTFHPNGKFAYCVEELSGMVSAYAYKNGKLDSIQRIFSYSKTQKSYGSADIHISPDGLFLYASNRWEDENTISIFSLNPMTGNLKLLGHQNCYGEHPRNFAIDPTGQFLLVANQVSNTVVVFKRNLKTGLLSKTKYVIKVPNPSCLQMRMYFK